MKNSVILLLIFLSLTSPISWAHEPGERVLLDESNIAYIYQSRSKHPPVYENIAYRVSSDYRNGDQFVKNELLPKLKPVIQKEIEHAKGIKKINININVPFSHYDFNSKGFPTNLREGSMLLLADEYLVVLDNVKRASVIPTKIELAKRISRTVPRPGRFVVRAEGIVGKVKPETRSLRKSLHIKLTAIELLLPNGTVVGRKKL